MPSEASHSSEHTAGGTYFPDRDDRYAGADSMQLLAEVRNMLKDTGYCLVNADCTVLAQAPKLAPHIPEMRRRLAGALGLDEGRVSVKATTEEGLGFTGSGAGIAAHAVCLLR